MTAKLVALNPGLARALARLRKGVIKVASAGARKFEAPDYMVHPHLVQQSNWETFGPPKSGKSFAVTKLCWEVASADEDEDWPMPVECGYFGFPVDVHGPVVWVASEAKLETMRRFEALRQQHGERAHEIHILPRVNMADENESKALALYCREVGAVLVVIDTVNRSGGGDEGPGDMGNFVTGAEKFREELGVAHSLTVMLIHHSPRANPNQPRGHSSLDGWVEGSWNVTKQIRKGKPSIYTVKVGEGRTSSSEAEAIGQFQLKTWKLQDEDGEMMRNRKGRLVPVGYVVPMAKAEQKQAEREEKIERSEAVFSGTIGDTKPLRGSSPEKRKKLKEAAAAVRDGATVTEAADKFGIHRVTLSKYIKSASDND